MSKKILLLLTILSASPTARSNSIKSLQDQHRLPTITGSSSRKMLQFADLESVEGIQEVPGIEDVHVLKISGEFSEEIPAAAFTRCKKLVSLELSGSMKLHEDALVGLEHLKALKLCVHEKLPEGLFRHVPNLKLLMLDSGLLKRNGLSVASLKQELPGVTVVVPKEYEKKSYDVKKIGLVTLVIGGIAGAIFYLWKQEEEKAQQYLSFTKRSSQRVSLASIYILNMTRGSEQKAKDAMRKGQWKSAIQMWGSAESGWQKLGEEYNAEKEYARSAKVMIQDALHASDLARQDPAPSQRSYEEYMWKKVQVFLAHSR